MTTQRAPAWQPKCFRQTQPQTAAFPASPFPRASRPTATFPPSSMPAFPRPATKTAFPPSAAPKQRTAAFPPSTYRPRSIGQDFPTVSKPFVKRGRLQVQHLQFVKLPSAQANTDTSTSSSYWPCLAFDSFEEMVGVLQALPDSFSTAKFQAAASLALHRQFASTPERNAPQPVVLRLGEKKALFDASQERISFFGASGIDQLIQLSQLAQDEGQPNHKALKEAMDDTKTFLAYFQKSQQQEQAGMPDNATTTTTAPLGTGAPVATRIADSNAQNVATGNRQESHRASRQDKDNIDFSHADNMDEAEPPQNESAAKANRKRVRVEAKAQERQIHRSSSIQEDPMASSNNAAETTSKRPRNESQQVTAEEEKDQTMESTAQVAEATRKRPREESQNAATTKAKQEKPLSSSDDETAVTNSSQSTVKSGKKSKSKRDTKSNSNKASATKARSQQCELLAIPSWQQVKPLLEELGYAFGNKLYCRPFGDPRTFQGVIEDQDYFSTQDALRSYLCANGIDYAGAFWHEDHPDRESIETWVRCSIITSGASGESLFYVPIKKGKGMKCLRKAGIKHATSELVDGYKIPGNDNIFEDSLLWEFLAKNGLPKTLDFEKIVDDRRDLEIFIALEIKLNSFQKRDLPSHIKSKEMDKASPTKSVETNEGNATDGMDSSSSIDHSPAVDKVALAQATRAPRSGGKSPFPMLRLDKMEDNTLAQNIVESPARVDDTASPHEAETHGPNPGASMHNSTEQAEIPAEDQNSIEEQSLTEEASSEDSQRSVPESDSMSNDEPAIAMEDFGFDNGSEKEPAWDGANVRDKLANCSDALKTRPGQAMIVSGRRAEALGEVARFVTAAIASKGRRGPRNGDAFLHVCGAPGSGKTMGIKKCCEKAVEKAILESEKWDKKPILKFMTASHLQHLSKENAIQRTLKHIGIPSGNSLKISKDGDDCEKAAVMLVLDEVDLLVASSNSFGSSSGTEEYLKTLVRWAADPKTRLTLIGISNTVADNKKGRRLANLGLGKRNKIVFTTYEKEDLIRIAMSRIGRSVVDPKVVEFIASKVAATSGDVRSFIALLAQSIEACQAKLPAAILDSNKEGPIVKLPHAMMVLRTKNTKYKDIIESLPSLEKYTLVCGVHLSRGLKDGKELPLSVLKNFSMEAFGFDPVMSDNHVSLEDFKGIVERLADSGLLKLEERDPKALSTEPISSLMNFPVKFGLQLEDVESALEETVLKEPFYQRIVDRIKSIQL